MIITAISDLHGEKPHLPGGDLLLIAGDLVAQSKMSHYKSFLDWLYVQPYRKIIFISGNHDKRIHELIGDHRHPDHIHYLCDTGVEFEGLKIWGSPWVLYSKIFNDHVDAFTKRLEVELIDRYNLIPEDTDILITHGPPYKILDRSKRGENCGSQSLRNLLFSLSIPLHVFGHIHEWGGMALETTLTKFFNASILDDSYIMRSDLSAFTFEFETKRKNERRNHTHGS
jgi:Icc-related predicted phosphoesterase